MPEENPDSPSMLLMEPLVEISTTNDGACSSSHFTYQGSINASKTISKIGECTVSVTNNNKH